MICTEIDDLAAEKHTPLIAEAIETEIEKPTDPRNTVEAGAEAREGARRRSLEALQQRR